MKKLLFIIPIAIIGGLLIGCSQPETPADTSSVVPETEAPVRPDGSVAGTGGEVPTGGEPSTANQPNTGP